MTDISSSKTREVITPHESKKRRAQLGEKILEFDEHHILGDGNCGFTSLGTTREEISGMLLSLAGDEKARIELADEIQGLLRENRESKLHTEETQKLFAKLDTTQKDVDEQVRQLNNQLSTEAKSTASFQRQNLEGLIERLQDSSDSTRQTSLTLLRADRLRIFQIGEKIKICCQSRDVFERYILEGLARTEWLGYRSAKLFAKLKQYNFYVFHPVANKPGWLEVAEHQECAAPKNAFYLLHTDGFTHYNLLSIASVSTLSADSKSATLTPKNTSPCELKIDFIALGKTANSIGHIKTKKITNTMLDVCEKRAREFNEDTQNPLMAPTLVETLAELEKMVINDEATIKNAGGDSTSLRRAQTVVDHVKKACTATKAQLTPSSAPITKTDPPWQVHRSRIEQQLLLNAPLQQPFNTALKEIASKARLDHGIPKGIFICYAKPDEKEPHLQWVIPFLEHLRSHLQMAGFSNIKLDVKDNVLGTAKHLYLKEIETDDFVLLIGTHTLRRHYESEDPTLLSAFKHIERKMKIDRALAKRSALPLLIHGTMESSFPALYESYSHLDFTHTSQKSYFQQLRRLIAHLYGMTEEVAFADIWEEFLTNTKKNQKETYFELMNGLSQKRVIEQLDIEQVQQTEEDKERAETERKLPVKGNIERKEMKRRSSAVEQTQRAQEVSGDAWHLPQPNDHYFTGRVTELKKLNELFSAKPEAKAKTMVLNAFSPVGALSGLGGVGKTQLAIYHIHHPVQSYALRIWFQAETETTLHKDYLKFAQQYKLPLEEKATRHELIKAVNRYLASQANWLAVYDNAGSYQELKDFLPTDLKNGHLIITTRRTEWHGKGTKLEVNVFNEAEAVAYLKKMIQRDEKHTEDEVKALAALVRELGYLPLALAQAGAYIETTGILIADYLRLYRQCDIEMLKDDTLPIDTNVLPVAITWDISLKAIEAEEQKAGDTKLSLRLLQAMSYLAPDHIPRSLLERWLTEGAFIRKDQSAELLLNKAVKRLLAYSMIQQNEKGEKTFNIHRLVQFVVRRHYPKDKELSKKIEMLEHCFADELEKQIDIYSKEGRSVSKKDDLLPHVLAIARNMQLTVSPSEKSIVAMMRVMKMVEKRRKEKPDKKETASQNSKDINQRLLSVLKERRSISEKMPHFLLAIIKGDREVAELFLNLGATLNERDQYDDNHLHLAVLADELEIIKWSIGRGARISERNKLKFTPLLLAVVKGNFEIVKYLLSNGAQLDEADDEKYTPLLYALLCGHTLIQDSSATLFEGHINFDIANWLLEEKYKNLNKSQYYLYKTVMQSESPLEEVEKALAENSASFTKYEPGHVALLIAICKGRYELVGYLLTKLCRELSGPEKQKSIDAALHFAACRGQTGIFMLLTEHGASIEKDNKNGFTPLSGAAFCGQLSMVKEIVSHFKKRNKLLDKKQLYLARQIADLNHHTGVVNFLKMEADSMYDKDETKDYTHHSAAVSYTLSSTSQSWHLPPRNDHYFTGRVVELKKLNETFAAKKEAKAMILSAVSGLGGVGKTQLAIYHIHHPEHPYALRIWFQAETDTTLNKEYLEFAQHYQLPLTEKASRDEIIQAVKQYLAKQRGWLAVYDNAGNYHEIKDFLLDELNNGHCIITTRRTEWHDKGHMLTVDVFSEEEAIAYIKKLLQRDDSPYSKSEAKALTELVREIRYLPLALAQAGAYIKRRNKTIENYLTLYRTQIAAMLADKTLPVDSSNVQSIATTWNISLKTIQEEEAAETKETGEPKLSLLVLQAISYLHCDHIPYDLLARWLHTAHLVKDQSAIERLLDKALGYLSAYSMIQSHVEQRTLSVHRLVQEVVRFQLQQIKSASPLVTSLESKGDAKATASTEQPHHSFLLASLTDSSLEEFSLETQILVDEKRRKALLQHLQALVKHHDSSSSTSTSPSVNLGMLLVSIGNVFSELVGDAGQAKLCYERALKIDEQHYGKDHLQVAITLNNLAATYVALGDAQTAKILLEPALKIHEQRYGKDHWHVASMLENLANAYGTLGDAQTPKMLLERALKIQEQYYGENHWRVANTSNNLAIAYGALGDIKTQKMLFERTLKIREQHYGKDHWQVAILLANLGVAHRGLGDNHQSKILQDKALSIFRKHYGNDHPQVAQLLMNLGATHMDLGNMQQAKTLLEQALPLFKKYYGNDHSQVALVLTNLGATSIVLDDMQQAKILLEQALPLLEKHYKKDHPHVALALMNLSSTYKNLGDEKQAFSLAQQAHSMFLKVYADPLHPHTQKAQLLVEMTQLELTIGPLCQPEILELLQQKEESAVPFFKNQGVDFNNSKIHQALICRYAHQQNIQGAICHVQILLRLLESKGQPVNYAHQILACYYHSYAHKLTAKDRLAAGAATIQAELHFKQSIESVPSICAYTDYANFLSRQHRITDTIQQLEYAIALNKTLTLESSKTTNRLTYQSIERATLDTDLQSELGYWKSLTLKAIHFAHYLLIIAYSQQSDQPAAKAALAAFQKLADTDNNSLTFSLLGHAYRATGDYATAITCYQCALELEPDYTVAEQQIAYCRQRCETSPGDNKTSLPSATQVESKRAETKRDVYPVSKLLGNTHRLFAAASIPSAAEIKTATAEQKGDSKRNLTPATAAVSTMESKENSPHWSSPENYDTHQLQIDLAQQAVKIQLLRQHGKFKNEPYNTFYQILITCSSEARHLDLSGNTLNDRDALCIAQFLQVSSHKLETLRLSHNRITSEGLELILNACAKKHTVQSLFLDHNQIDFERHFCETVLQLSVLKTNLKHLDLSMNFIYEGEVLEDKGIAGTPVKIVRDEKAPEHKLTKEKAQYCKLFFQNSPIVKSNCLSQPLQSILNPEKMIDRDCGMVSLLAFKTTLPPFGEHAFLGIEGIHDFGQRYIMMAELFETPKGIKVYLTYCSPQEYLYRTKDGEKVHGRSARIEIGKINQLKEEILTSRSYEEFGNYALVPGNRQGVYNCFTWAVKILGSIGIKMEVGWFPSQAVKQNSQGSSIGRCIIS